MRNRRIAATLSALAGNELQIMGTFAKEQRAAREKANGLARRYMNHRLKTNVQARMTSLLRTRLGMAIRHQATVKARKTMQLLGCTIAEFMAHIAAQFTEGMSWDNHGEWEIDHVKPCRAFNLKDAEQQRACFNYTNLQPLWLSDNRRKSDQWEGQRARHSTP